MLKTLLAIESTCNFLMNCHIPDNDNRSFTVEDKGYVSSHLQIWDSAVAIRVLYDFSLTIKAAPHECVIRTGQP